MEGLGLWDEYVRVHCTLVPRMSVKFQTQTETRHSTVDAEERREIAGLLVEADDGSPDTLRGGPLGDLSVKARTGGSPDAPRSRQLSEPRDTSPTRGCEGG